MNTLEKCNSRLNRDAIENLNKQIINKKIELGEKQTNKKKLHKQV